jgi:heptosyltransferase-2
VLNRNHIGDCILTTPMLRAIKRRFPRAHVAVSVPASNQDLLVTNPHVDEIVVRPKLSSWGAKFGFAFEIRERGYDLIISLQEKSLFYAWATSYAGSRRTRRRHPVTIGLDHPRTRRWYQHNVPVRSDQHEVYKYLDIAHLLGCPHDRNPVLELEPTAAARERVDRFINSRGIHSDVRFVGINPGGTKADKRWPAERFAEVGDRLQEDLGLPVMVFGGRGDDEERASLIADRMRHRPLVMAGRAELADTAALLERCQLFVTNDTGPMHMAVALAVPVVALFGPTNPVKFGPFSTLKKVLRHRHPCPTCWKKQTVRPVCSLRPKHPEIVPCVHTIEPDEVVDAALNLYQAPPVRSLRVDRSA